MGPGSQVAQPPARAKPGEVPGFAARAAISQTPPEGGAERAVVAQGRQQGTASTAAAFARLDDGIGDSRIVIEGDMDEFPTGPG